MDGTYTTSKQLDLFPVPNTDVEKQIIIRALRQYTTEHFYLPSSVIGDRYLRYHKLLFWKGTYLLEKMQEGTITRDGIIFQVHFYGRSKLSRGAIVRNPEAQYCISFRATKEEYPILPVALIASATVLPVGNK